jgi:Uma2 family endonuclease
MSQTTTIISPADHGRRMSLAEFEHAEAREGRLYELSRGVITAIDVPNVRHFKLVDAVRCQYFNYQRLRPDGIYAIASGSECKLVIEGLESERHPDLAIYKTPPPKGDSDDDVWSHWIPEIVVEVISPSSRHRDYEEKPEEYLRFGVREYWIVDAELDQLQVLYRSRGRWAKRRVKPPDVHRTGLLPGFQFSIEAVFKAAGTKRT